jgi:glucose/arabinose dehydrogenase
MRPSWPRFSRFLAVHTLALGVLGLLTLQGLAQQAVAPAGQPETLTPELQRRLQMGGYRPERMQSQGLSGHPPKLTVTPLEELPIQHLQVPPGFKIEVWAHGFPGGRMMTRGEQGTIFMGTRNIGRVYAIQEKHGTRTATIVIDKLVQPNGVLFHNGSLYVAAINQVLRFDNIEGTLDKPPQPADMTAAFQLPPEVHHNWKFLAYGPDKKIYIPVGAPCNLCEINPGVHGHIRRYNLDGSGMEIVARGVRNSVGFDFHPQTGELWFTDNGRDWGGEDGFEEELNRVPQGMLGAHFGFPYCHANGQPDPDIQVPQPCANVVLPVTTLGPHTAALGMRFYTGTMFPAEYRNAILVARRGSWNRTIKSGYDVLMVTATPDGKQAQVKPFVTGFLDHERNAFRGRPADVLPMPDGSVLVADEQNGAIYRVSYEK